MLSFVNFCNYEQAHGHGRDVCSSAFGKLRAILSYKSWAEGTGSARPITKRFSTNLACMIVASILLC
jgi:hypothetical protein